MPLFRVVATAAVAAAIASLPCLAANLLVPQQFGTIQTAISADGAVFAGDCSTPGGERSFIIRNLQPRAGAADLDGDDEANAADIALLLVDFGTADGFPPDLDGTGEVDAADIALILLDFGACTCYASAR